MQYPPQGNPQQPYGQQSYPSQPGFVSQPLPQGYAQPGQMQPPPFTPPTPPQKKPKRWPWIIALIVVFFIGLGIGSGTHSGGSAAPTDTTTTTTQPGGGTAAQPTSATTKPVASAKWTTTHTFSGSGSKKTSVFAVGDDWKIVWSCKPSSFYGGQYNVIVGVTNSDNTPADPAAVNTMCKAGNTGDTTEEHTGGNVYLDVNSEADWTIMVQELK